MGKMNEFFEEIIREQDSIMCAMDYLSARGFLLDYISGEWYVSDNSHKCDIESMDRILKVNNIGHVDEKCKIHILNEGNIETLRNLFESDYKVGFESEANLRSWQWFRRREHGYKIPTMDLEPFVAMYVKAISACGVETWFSCDGNNHRDLAIEIGMNGTPNKFWHKIMWEKTLKFKFDLPWENEYEYIKLDKNKFMYYAELNKVAKFLYENRKQFRNMKKEVISILTPSKERSMTSTEIQKLIEIRMDDYLKEHAF